LYPHALRRHETHGFGRRMVHAFCLAVLCPLLFSGLSLSAEMAPQTLKASRPSPDPAAKPYPLPGTLDGNPSSQLFPTPPIVRKQIRFWERIFRTYPSTTLLIHDSQNPDIIVDILDFADRSKCPDCAPKTSRKHRESVAKQFLDRYIRGLTRFAQIRDKALEFGAIERRLFDVYGRDPALLNQLYRGSVRLRIQTGLADEFTTATATAQAYFPAMERIFLDQGLPTALTRLPFVESMFNTKAVSKVGASGVWQFMPETGRRFLFIGPHIDERNSPIKATRAAAQLMLANYQDLKSWPLAITAYNHGSLGMMKAIKDTGSQDIGTIIENYKSPSFGFASRNFYAEFLAAHRTFQSLAREGKITSKTTLSETEQISLPHPMTPNDLMKVTGLSATEILTHNPCLLSQAFGKYLHRHLPKGYIIFFPKHAASRIKTNLDKFLSTRYARR
jgi:membrane-bound lytic murein transglycosylase D